MRYEVGDKVVMRNDLRLGGQYGKMAITEQMESFLESESTPEIERIDTKGLTTYVLKGCTAPYWTDEMINHKATLIKNFRDEQVAVWCRTVDEVRKFNTICDKLKIKYSSYSDDEYKTLFEGDIDGGRPYGVEFTCVGKRIERCYIGYEKTQNPSVKEMEFSEFEKMLGEIKKEEREEEKVKGETKAIYKAGDKVVIKSLGECIDLVNWSPPMREGCGRTYEVESASNSYFNKEENVYFLKDSRFAWEANMIDHEATARLNTPVEVESETPVLDIPKLMKVEEYSYDTIKQPFTNTVKGNGESRQERGSFRRATPSHKFIFNDRAVICILADGSKGVSKCLPEDEYNETRGKQIAFNRAKIKSLTKELKKLCK